MKKQLKAFVSGALLMILLNNVVLADEIKETIEVMYNKVGIEIHGEKTDINTLLYSGTTYVPVREISEAFGKEVNWNHKTFIASINNSEKGEKIDSNEYEAQTARIELENMGKEIADMEDMGSIYGILEKYRHDSQMNVANIYFAEEETGKMHLYPDISLPEGYDPRGRAWYSKAKVNEYYISDLYLDIATSDSILTISLPIYNNEQIIGVLGMDIIIDKK